MQGYYLFRLITLCRVLFIVKMDDDDDFGDFESSTVSNVQESQSQRPEASSANDTPQVVPVEYSAASLEEMCNISGSVTREAFSDLWNNKTISFQNTCSEDSSENQSTAPPLIDDDELLTFLWSESNISKNLKTATSECSNSNFSPCPGVEMNSNAKVESFLNSLPKIDFLLGDAFVISH